MTVIYECVRCGEQMTDDELGFRGESIKCISCGFKVLRKTKPPVVKKVDTK